MIARLGLKRKSGVRPTVYTYRVITQTSAFCSLILSLLTLCIPMYTILCIMVNICSSQVSRSQTEWVSSHISVRALKKLPFIQDGDTAMTLGKQTNKQKVKAKKNGLNNKDITAA